MPNSKNIRTTPEAQENSRWTFPAGALGRLTSVAFSRADKLAGREAELERLAGAMTAAPSLRTALDGGDIALIAEIKRSSPSRGAIRPELDASTHARAYKAGGAAAISVLTEPDSFGGRDEDIQAALAAGLPILKKDFHVAAVQLFQARALGASAALLIIRALLPSRLEQLFRAADSVGLEIVAEVRDETELERALEAGARIIGVNNRNLETLVIEGGTADALIPRIPRDCIAVAESGYSSRASIKRVAACGADAILIGSYLSAAADPVQAVHRLTGVRRESGGR